MYNGWIWFKGIKPTNPAKTAALMLDAAMAGESFLGRDSLKRRGGVRAWWGFLPCHTPGLLGEASQGQDCLHLLPLPGSFRIPTLAWVFSTGPPGLQPQQVPGSGLWDLPTLMHTYLCLVSWPPGAGTKSVPGPWAPNLGDVRSFSQTHLKAQKVEGESLTGTLLRLYKLICKS